MQLLHAGVLLLHTHVACVMMRLLSGCVCECRQQDKAVILASDGLWDVVSESEAVSVVKTSLGGGTAELKVRRHVTQNDR